ncbi:hypothetical protein K9N68_35970 (plasmid) [Kovacikia minuta CCNUW1]|uniref:hypothetical protein n=1 Tax=Kovacikia minuta TaxID=2931930 RepID=UPI001CCBE438|nr:hypothetical protein [Kovacikia minuta]UBF30576.1 hypothetical protein K9N68_35970 [Kovacikia minuta CCNUW1]
MTASTISAPEFQRGQRVSFTGGEGIIQAYKFEAGSWTYQVEMAMGLEPDFGRVGYETTIVLGEADLVCR